MRRSVFLVAFGLLFGSGSAAEASRQDDKRAFLAECDESISISRLAGAPHKFVGRKVDIHGTVGPAMEETSAFNLDDVNDGTSFVVVHGDARNLEQNQAVRVLGIVREPISGTNTAGGNGVYAVVDAKFVQ